MCVRAIELDFWFTCAACSIYSPSQLTTMLLVNGSPYIYIQLTLLFPWLSFGYTVHHNLSSNPDIHIMLASRSAHTKLEARTTLQYVQCESHIYQENRTFRSLGGLVSLTNCVICCMLCCMCICACVCCVCVVLCVCVVCVCVHISTYGGSSGGTLIAYISLWVLCI